MSIQKFDLTDVEDVLLSAYAASQGSAVTVSDLIVANGKGSVIQSALRAYASRAASTGSVDKAVLSVVSKNSDAIFNAVWSDWNDKKAFSGVVAALLQAPSSAPAAS